MPHLNLRVHKYGLGNAFVLAWKASEKDCQVEILELIVELTVRAFNSATEKFPRSHTESSATLLPGIEVCRTQSWFTSAGCFDAREREM